MVSTCIIKGCHNRNTKSRSDKMSSGRSQDLTFHRIPQNPQLRDKWVAAILKHQADYKPEKSHLVCSDHFRREDYDDDGFRRILKKGNVPVIFNITRKFKKKKRRLCKRTIRAVSDQDSETSASASNCSLPSESWRSDHSYSQSRENQIERLSQFRMKQNGKMSPGLIVQEHKVLPNKASHDVKLLLETQINHFSPSCHDNTETVESSRDLTEPAYAQQSSVAVCTFIMQTSSASFTVEQVELIRRLWNSGVTSQQIVEAFQTLDRIDVELGTLYSIPRNHPILRNESQDCGRQQGVAAISEGQTSIMCTSSVTSFRDSHAVHSNSPLSQGTTSLSMNAPAAGKFSDTLRAVAQASMSVTGKSNRTFPNSPDVVKQEKIRVKLNNGEGPSQSMNRSSTASPLLNEKVDLRDMTMDRFLRLLLSLTGETLRMLVQKFVMMLPNFDQQKQAAVLGVDEMALYNFLNGHWQAIEPLARNKILTWYYNQVKSMDWFFEDLSQFLKIKECSEGLDIHFVPRRERFTFRDKHIEVLEMFFKKGQYPTQEEKEHIANECNIAMSIDLERDLAEKEKMTHINVTNWFSNRRKEIKRIAKKGGIETEKVILPSRLKPKVLAHLPTYTELQDEQMARQKISGLLPPVTAGLYDSTPSMNYETDSSSQDNSNLVSGCHSAPCPGCERESSSQDNANSNTPTDNVTLPQMTGEPDADSSEPVNLSTSSVPSESERQTNNSVFPHVLVKNEHTGGNADGSFNVERMIKTEPVGD